MSGEHHPVYGLGRRGANPCTGGRKERQNCHTCRQPRSPVRERGLEEALRLKCTPALDIPGRNDETYSVCRAVAGSTLEAYSAGRKAAQKAVISKIKAVQVMPP